LKSITSRDNPAYKAMHRLVSKSGERKASAPETTASAVSDAKSLAIDALIE